MRPDLTTLGKIVGGGLPVGAYGGSRDLLSKMAPGGPVYQAGTLSGNPLAMEAGLAMLGEITRRPPYAHLERMGALLEEGIREAAASAGVADRVAWQRVGSLGTLFFAPGEGRPPRLRRRPEERHRPIREFLSRDAPARNLSSSRAIRGVVSVDRAHGSRPAENRANGGGESRLRVRRPGRRLAHSDRISGRRRPPASPRRSSFRFSRTGSAAPVRSASFARIASTTASDSRSDRPSASSAYCVIPKASSLSPRNARPRPSRSNSACAAALWVRDTARISGLSRRAWARTSRAWKNSGVATTRTLADLDASMLEHAWAAPHPRRSPGSRPGGSTRRSRAPARRRERGSCRAAARRRWSRPRVRSPPRRPRGPRRSPSRGFRRRVRGGGRGLDHRRKPRLGTQPAHHRIDRPEKNGLTVIETRAPARTRPRLSGTSKPREIASSTRMNENSPIWERPAAIVNAFAAGRRKARAIATDAERLADDDDERRREEHVGGGEPGFGDRTAFPPKRKRARQTRPGAAASRPRRGGSSPSR